MLVKQIRFNDKWSYDDFGLKLLECTINPPAVKLNQVDNPGGNGIIDVSDWMGYLVYNNRDASFVFDLQAHNMTEMEEKLSNLYDSLNGQEAKIYIGDGWYYTGRIVITTSPINNLFKMVTITSSVYPYKFKEDETIVRVTASSTEQRLQLCNSKMIVIPSIKTTGEVQIKYDGKSFVLSAGEYINPDFVLKDGDNEVIIKGSGTVTFKYREGRF